MHAPTCGIFCFHSVDVVSYAALIQEKSSTNCNAHLTESIFQTRSSVYKLGSSLKSVYLIATRDLSNLWLQFFLSQNQGFMRLFEKTVLK